ncbi:hypothetical protein [Curtobacterium sp. MCBD17_013]|uniref:hypothetical protein n=1 Tax=Curtobacterium sp. MCBD17_013 TaxID=2175668 RepID=UPI0011B4722A|nr:hypothetical protein [Curtobacterium sp. MCBD17_013]
MPSDLYQPPDLRRGLWAGALIVGLLLLLVGGVFGGVLWVTTAISSGSHVAAAPRSFAYGICDAHAPWSCPAVPSRTIASEFGRAIPLGASVFIAEAEPTAGITGTPQIQVVMELPKGDTASGWLSLIGTADPVADPNQIPELGHLGVTGMSGGASGFTSVYAGELNGRVYVWAYRRL